MSDGWFLLVAAVTLVVIFASVLYRSAKQEMQQAPRRSCLRHRQIDVIAERDRVEP